MDDKYAVILNGTIYDSDLDIIEANKILDEFSDSTNIGLVPMTQIDVSLND